MSPKILSLLLLVISCHAAPVEETKDKKPAGLTTYDQRQTGKYNVHVNIKDVQFFSVSDSLAGIGGDYEDYGDYDILEGGYGEGDSDYDVSHLTVNPILALLGSKPTTPKPTTAEPPTEKLPQSSSTSEASSIATQEATTTTHKPSSTSTSAPKQESQESEVKDSEVLMAKPASPPYKKPQQVNEAIDYEEIPVEVQYYRANHHKLPLNVRQHAATNVNRFRKRPSVVVIDSHGRTNNVKILDSEGTQTVKICNHGEFRDNLGRCRVRARRGASVGGLRRIFNILSRKN